MNKNWWVLTLMISFQVGRTNAQSRLAIRPALKDSSLQYRRPPKVNSTDWIINRSRYVDKLSGFWLGECIANWTGLITEMDKIGNVGDIKTGAFYTRKDWGKEDQKNIWGGGGLSDHIQFLFAREDSVWGSDDDTDLEYMYQYLLLQNKTSILSPEQIRDGWLRHIKSEEENYLWLSNQNAFDLMKKGYLTPQTSDPYLNPDYEMIDAQLTTEIFGFYAPTRPDISLKMAKLPILTTARGNAKWIAEFYVLMYNLAGTVNPIWTQAEKIIWMAKKARKHLPDSSYSAKMFDFVMSKYRQHLSWEQVRDSVYQRYQVEQKDGYTITSRHLFCNGCSAAGINFASSIISLLYGRGDIKETIKIASLMGWDSDNPTATWGGLIGFMIGKKEIEKAFHTRFSDKYNIHRTRINFPHNGMDDFGTMARNGILVIDRVVQEEMGGWVDLNKDQWHIPRHLIKIPPAENEFP